MASDASTPVEFGEERSPQIDELVPWVIQHREHCVAVVGRKRDEVAGEGDGIEQDASCVIGAVPSERRRELECLLAGDADAGDYRHGREILGDRQRPSEWVTSDNPLRLPNDVLRRARRGHG